MHLFYAEKLVAGGRQKVLIYARNESEAIAYLKNIPRWWHHRFEPTDFTKVAAPKGPSPSILMDDLGNTVNED